MNVHPTSNVSLLEITPEYARALLDKSEGNRNNRKVHVAALAHDMKAGNFPVTGDTIKLDKCGRLIDGHHRLAACLEANTPFKSYVIYGVEPSAAVNIDSGISRTVSDSLKIAGDKNASNVSACVRQMHRLATLNFDAKLTVSDVLTVLDKHPNLRRALPSSHKGYISSMLGLIYVGAVIQHKPDRVAAFVQVQKTGIPDYHGCPAHAFRERINRAAIGGMKLTPFKRTGLLISAWEHFVVKKPVQQLYHKEDQRLTGFDEHVFWNGPRA